VAHDPKKIHIFEKDEPDSNTLGPINKSTSYPDDRKFGSRY
jgi:hypothetical protein